MWNKKVVHVDMAKEPTGVWKDHERHGNSPFLNQGSDSDDEMLEAGSCFMWISLGSPYWTDMRISFQSFRWLSVKRIVEELSPASVTQDVNRSCVSLYSTLLPGHRACGVSLLMIGRLALLIERGTGVEQQVQYMHPREHGKAACSAVCRSSWIGGCRLHPRWCCSALGVVVWLGSKMGSRWIGDLQAKSPGKHLQIHKMLIAVNSPKRLKSHA